MVTVIRVLISLLPLFWTCFSFDLPLLRMIRGKERDIVARSMLRFQPPRLDLLYRNYEYPPDRSVVQPMVVFDGRLYSLRQ
ncbi:hypothetical protein GCK32_004974 [Trichostrongylus colubriformis]|uniref:Uncharacterized protein n=1 Tax=Trichostrongylus colubriformis TaxID=6319 RepID=A0AAN8G2Z5_TRICO